MTKPVDLIFGHTADEIKKAIERRASGCQLPGTAMSIYPNQLAYAKRHLKEYKSIQVMIEKGLLLSVSVLELAAILMYEEQR